jgi:[calcium/calmodulin-dependent protein kinase] kinase
MTNALEKVQREVDIMRQIWHPNVVPLFGVLDDPNDDSLYLVLELEEKGQIMDWDGRTLQYKSRHFPLSTLTGGISEDHLRPLVIGMTNGLAALHAQRIIHRDIKPDNVLLSAAGVPKLADFGTAKQFASDDTEGLVSDSAGTFHFFSPESCSGENYSGYTTDVWALGVTIYCCVFGRVPWLSKDHNPQELFDKIQHQPWQVPDGATITPALNSLLTSLLEKDPTKRLSLSGILTHPWVTKT